MLVVHGTKKFLDRAGRPDPADDRPSSTALGPWYANVWFWRAVPRAERRFRPALTPGRAPTRDEPQRISAGQVALFVNETTLFPVLVPMAPASSVVRRFTAAAREAFARQGLDSAFVAAELHQMSEHRLAKTASRSVLGVMNEFGYLADAYRDDHGEVVLPELTAWLAAGPEQVG